MRVAVRLGVHLVGERRSRRLEVEGCTPRLALEVDAQGTGTGARRGGDGGPRLTERPEGAEDVERWAVEWVDNDGLWECDGREGGSQEGVNRSKTLFGGGMLTEGRGELPSTLNHSRSWFVLLMVRCMYCGGGMVGVW